jgi:hypothetical protein
MNYKKQDNFKFLFFTSSIASVGFVLLLLIIFLWSPYQGDLTLENYSQINILSVVGFYIALLLFFSGIFSTIFFLVQSKIITSKELYSLAVTSLRRGVLMGIFICILAILQSMRLLIWWDILLLAVAVILVEMYLLAIK